MVEDPIKLFASRAERYPQPTEADVIQGSARVVLAAVPVLGGSITEALSMILAPSVARRRDEWFKELADGLDQLETKAEGFKVENLLGNEAFVSATIQATLAAASTHQRAKREYLRNALLNIALGKNTDELKQQLFLSAVEALTTAHIRTLDLLWRGFRNKQSWDQLGTPLHQRTYAAAMQIVSTELKGQPGLCETILADLRNRGFSKLGNADVPFPQGPQITNLGIEFLSFVLTPEDLP